MVTHQKIKSILNINRFDTNKYFGIRLNKYSDDAVFLEVLQKENRTRKLRRIKTTLERYGYKVIKKTYWNGSRYVWKALLIKDGKMKKKIISPSGYVGYAEEPDEMSKKFTKKLNKLMEEK